MDDIAERIAYKRERSQSFWAEFFSWLSCGIAMCLGYQRELTLSCVAEMRKQYGTTEHERALGVRWCHYINRLPFNRSSDNHCRDALAGHITTWKRLLGLTVDKKS